MSKQYRQYPLIIYKDEVPEEVKYEVGKVQFHQNTELMKYVKKYGVQAIKTEDGYDLTQIYNQICEDNEIGKLLSFMVRPVGENWHIRQTEDDALHKALLELYEEEVESIFETFFEIKKKWSESIQGYLTGMIIKVAAPLIQIFMTRFFSSQKTQETQNE